MVWGLGFWVLLSVLDLGFWDLAWGFGIWLSFLGLGFQDLA